MNKLVLLTCSQIFLQLGYICKAKIWMKYLALLSVLSHGTQQHGHLWTIPFILCPETSWLSTLWCMKFIGNTSLVYVCIQIGNKCWCSPNLQWYIVTNYFVTTFKDTLCFHNLKKQTYIQWSLLLLYICDVEAIALWKIFHSYCPKYKENSYSIFAI